MFPTTRWSYIASAPPAEVASAIASAYWRPLYILARRRGLPPDRAEDAVQSVFARLLALDFVAALDRTRGRLRAFLRTTLEHVLVDELVRARAQKRGGGLVALPIDDLVERLAEQRELTPDEAFDRVWTATLLERAFARFIAEQGPIVQRFFTAAEPPALATLAAEHATTVSAVKSLLHRARRRYAAIVREEVAATLAPGVDVDDELRALGV